MLMISALGVYDQCKKQKLGIDYLLTYKMSQDHIETFFSAVRRKGRVNNNPSVSQFKTTYKKLLVHHEITGSKYGNCVAMDSTKIFHVSSLIRKGSLSSGITIDNVEFNEVVDHDYSNVLLYCDNTVNDIVSYIAGFVVK